MESHGSSVRSGDFLRKRVACEVAVEGRTYKGVATELAPHEIFVQLAGSSLPKRGAAVAIHLRDDLIGGDGLEIQAVVSRQERGEVDDRGLTRGIRLRIVEAPAEFHALFGAGPYEDTTEVEILVEVGPTGGEPVLADPDARIGSGSDDASDAVSASDAGCSPDSDSDDADLPGRRPKTQADGGVPTAPAQRDALNPGESASRGVVEAPLGGSYGEPAAVPRTANAIVVYDGEKLQDVYELLQRLGVRPERARMSGPTRFRGWDRPPKLLIAEAQDAVSIDWPQNLIADGVVRIAVASSASAVLGKMLRSQGFHYLVRRPVHDKALEVLLRHALHRGTDRRDQRRSPLGIDARLGTGAWHWPSTCTLLELSALGCRVVSLEDVPLLSPVTLRIGRRISGTRPIALRARVARRRFDETSGEWMLALRFIEVPAEQRGRIDDLLARTSIGPTSKLVESPVARLRLRVRRLLSPGGPELQPLTLDGPVSLPAPEAAPSPPLPERRTAPRGAMDREVVTLDDDREHVTAVLTGRDLSTLGMRVDPHPEFYVGRRVVVAFFDWVSRGTIEVAAEVVRDDGDRGMGIRFLDMEPSSAARLEQLVAELPGVESLGPRARPLMVARIVPDGVVTPEAVEAPAPARVSEPVSFRSPEPATGEVSLGGALFDASRVIAEPPARPEGPATDHADAPAPRSILTVEPASDPDPDPEPVSAQETEPAREPVPVPVSDPDPGSESIPVSVAGRDAGDDTRRLQRRARRRRRRGRRG